MHFHLNKKKLNLFLILKILFKNNLKFEIKKQLRNNKIQNYKKKTLKMKQQDSLIKNLHLVSKELDQLKRVRECRKEFESDFENLKYKVNEICMKEEKSFIELKNEENANSSSLHMEVYEDKDYDIEEIKSWNFNSKNKSIKQNIIRTHVYKYPESSYIVRQCTIHVQENHPMAEKCESKQENDDSDSKLKVKKGCEKATQTSLKDEEIMPKKEIPKPQEDNKLNAKPPKISESISLASKDLIKNVSTNAKPVTELNNSMLFISQNSKLFNVEDLIIVEDDEDDILNYEELEDDETEMLKLKNTSQMKNKLIKDEKNNKNNAVFVEDEGDHSDSSLKSSKRLKKQSTRPKLVIEKAAEPISSININVNSSQNTRPRRSSSSLSTTRPQQQQQQPAMTQVTRRLSQRRNSRSSVESNYKAAVSASSSSSSVYSITATNDRTLRVTRSKTKLVNDK
jgi:hypothetical protein